MRAKVGIAKSCHVQRDIGPDLSIMSEIVQDEHEGKLLFQNDGNSKNDDLESDEFPGELQLGYAHSSDEIGKGLKSKKRRDLFKNTKGATTAILAP